MAQLHILFRSRKSWIDLVDFAKPKNFTGKNGLLFVRIKHDLTFDIKHQNMFSFAGVDK